MKKVTAIPVEGAWVRGPCKVKLTKEQHARRVFELGRDYPRGGIFELTGGQAINFKRGEKFSINTPDRLNKALFEVDEPKAKEDPSVGTTSAGGNSVATQDPVAGSSASEVDPSAGQAPASGGSAIAK